MGSNSLNIESHIFGNEFSGKSAGILIRSSIEGYRPEGIHIVDNTIVCGGVQLSVQEALFLRISGNTFDQYKGNNAAILFDPGFLGIESVLFEGNWVAAQGQGNVRGCALKVSNSSKPAATIGVSIHGNVFAFAGTGVCLSDTAVDVIIGGNNFHSIQGFAVRCDQSRSTTIVSNTYRRCGSGLYLQDGTSGGPFIVDMNQFDVSALHEVKKTDATRFRFGALNSGQPLER